MSFSVYNTFDGSTQTPGDGDVIFCEVDHHTLLVIECTTDQGSGQDFTWVINGGNLTSAPDSIGGSGPGTVHGVCAVSPEVPSPDVDQLLRIGVAMFAGILERFSIVARYHGAAPASGGVSPNAADLSAIPEDTIDLQVGLRTRIVQSALLPLVPGFKVGDKVKFAVRPMLDSGFVDSIDSITLALRPAGKFDGDPLEFDLDSSPSDTGSGGGEHYPLDIILDDDALASWFRDQNALAQGADETADPTKLLVSAELRFEQDGDLITSDTFQFYLKQSVVAPSE